MGGSQKLPSRPKSAVFREAQKYVRAKLEKFVRAFIRSLEYLERHDPTQLPKNEGADETANDDVRIIQNHICVINDTISLYSPMFCVLNRTIPFCLGGLSQGQMRKHYFRILSTHRQPRVSVPPDKWTSGLKSSDTRYITCRTCLEYLY